MIDNSVKLWAKAADTSDECLIARLQASSICLHIFQTEGRRGWKAANLLLAGHLCPLMKICHAYYRVRQGLNTAFHGDDIEQ